MPFRGIKGQERAVAFLSRTLESGRLAQAYLFLGPEGVGKKAVALRFAQAINCQAGAVDRPCGCGACRKIDAGSHPDVRVVVPLEDKTAIGIDQIRDVMKDAALKPYEGAKKVYIIDGAGRMKREAQSAFLKTLEEPSGGRTVFILIAERAEDLFPTIVSRAETVRFSPLAKDDVKAILMKEHDVAVARAHVIAGITLGRIGEAIRYAADERFFERRAKVLDGLIDGTFGGADSEKLSKDQLEDDLAVMLTWFRDLLITKAADGRPIPGVINIDRKEAIAREAKRYSREHLDTVLGEILSAGRHLDANVNAKLAMAVLAMEIHNPKESVCTKSYR